MIVEVISVGTELLIGQIVNSNAAWIGRRLAEEGFDVNHQVTVGDNLARLSGTITTALQRADAVIMTGGIGPTQDDLTREAICLATGRAMDRDDEHAERIRRRILARRAVVAETVLRMAEYPAGAEPLPNTQGVALGVALRHNSGWIFAVPGVPREMSAMIDTEVMPRLRRAAGKAAIIRSRVLHTWGYGESQVSEMLDDLYASTNPSIAFLISDMEVRVRITAKADTEDEVETSIAPIEDEVRSRLGDAVFATDDKTVLDVISSALEDQQWTVAVHEDATDGLVLHRLSALDRFAGGSLIRGRATATDLAKHAATAFDANVGVGISVPAIVEDAGDLATEIEVAVATPVSTSSNEMRFFGIGERARAYAAIAALHRLRIELRH